MSVDIIIIRGAPGVGKSSVAKQLAMKLGTGVTIEIDKIRGMIINVNWTDTTTHINAIIAATALVLQYLQQGYKPVILIDTLSGGTLGYVADRITGHTYRVFSLTALNSILKERILTRNGAFMDYERSYWVNSLILDSSPPNNHFIDTSHSSINDVCDQLLFRL